MFYYIDPGTGSMLFSIVIGIAATLYFSLRALTVKLKMKFSTKDVKATLSQEKKPYVIYCEGKQYFNVFRPIVDEFEKRGLPLVYYTSAEDDPVLTAGFPHVTAEYIGSGNKAFARLNFLDADVVLMTTPGLDVYQLKRSKNVRHYSHILHMPSDPTTYRMFGLDFFDSVLLTGDYQKADIRYLEKLRTIKAKDLVTVGCTYLDVLQEKFAAIQPNADHQFTVLVAPSWGPSALLSRFGERLLDPLVETGLQVIVRPHPQSKTSEKEMLDRLQKRYEGKGNIRWDFEPDNSMALSQADIMISDFSGVVFDYTFLRDKPVLYMLQGFDPLPYDCDDIPHELWQFSALKKFGIPLQEEDLPRIGQVIQAASDSPALAAARHAAKAEAWANEGHAAEKVVDYFQSVEQKVQGEEASRRTYDYRIDSVKNVLAFQNVVANEAHAVALDPRSNALATILVCEQAPAIAAKLQEKHIQVTVVDATHIAVGPSADKRLLDEIDAIK